MRKSKLLQPSLVLLFLILLPTDASVSGKPQYMVLVPSLLHSGTSEKACVLLSNLNETVTVSVSLEALRENRSLFTDLVAQKDLFHCISFIVRYLQPSANEISSLKGSTQEFRRRNTVVVKNQESLVFVQTDKPIYKPGQTVKFRIVSLDENFHPLNELDPKGNRIIQWQNLKLESGLKQLSFPLSSEPLQGIYNVVVQKESSGTTEHPFAVEEFVLPKFEVQVTMPKIITIMEEEVNVSVCGLYTYGKPVPGHVTMSICRKYNNPSNCFGEESEAFCEKFSQKLNSHGCFFQQVKASIFHLKKTGYEMQLQVEAKIQEEGTGVEVTGRGSSEITNTITKLSFVTVDSHVRQGIPFFGQVRLVDGKGIPMPNKIIFITANEANYHSNATTNEDGLVQFSINTTNIIDTSLSIMVKHKDHSPCYNHQWLSEENENAYHTANVVFSLSKSFIHLEPIPGKLPCGQSQTVQAHYLLNEQVLQELKQLIFYYLIMAKGGIVRTGTHVLPVEQGDMKGHFSVTFLVESDLAPIARLLIYAILPDGEMVGDSAKYEIENCLANKVDLSFRPVQTLPASHAQLRVTASPQSLCALRAVDQSVLLMRPEAELSRSRRTVFTFTFIVFSLTTIAPVALYRSQIQETDVPVSHKETVRKYFPETWIWDLVVVDSSGVAEVGGTVPDTITEWKAGALCLSNDTGLGLSPTASLRVFQPFFVELTMPYSVVRGEAFTLKATVLNYLPKCIRLETSPTFLAVPVEKEQGSHCICGDGRHTVSWEVTPKSLGNVNFTVSAEALESQELCGSEVAMVPKYGKKDTIIKLLLVEVSEPVNLIKTYCRNSFPMTDLFLPLGAEVSEQLSLKLPPNVVEESARASVSVLGDILGSAMQNTQNLLQMPYGCGEQNMVLFAPNIYVLDYLNETQQLTPEIKSRAIGYLNTGYQRQLNYKHQDGSYSTFGEKYGRNQGNTWLTAFVLKTFAQARKYIFIDETHITQALTWLSQKQKDNGCFRSSGSLLNNAIKGGVEDEVTLSAYITIALLEIPLPVTHPVVRNALFCLDSAWKSAKEGAHGTHVYTKALLAYAFALADNQDKRKEVLNSLDEEAVKEDNTIHWTRPQKPKAPQGLLYQPQAPSAEVEMTAYVLLTLLTVQPAPTSKDLTSAVPIVKWITKQQNSHGGFSSTQDTVVTLHALSKYGAATFTRTGKAAQVTIQSSGTFSSKFQVDNNNRLLLQRVSLPTVPGEYSARVTGEGCVYLQTSLKYNILPDKEDFPFALEVLTLPQTCDGPKSHTTFQISMNIRYTGSRPASNMVIADVKMVSGFIPLKPTVKMKRKLPGKDLKPAIVKVYDYYETDEFAIAEYSAPCSKGK
uniref:Alpha-2-macroglobulin n=1 Tax=Marmota marmota marmota TaxID=9994 RepID=A0A8C5ZTB5_MARMA